MECWQFNKNTRECFEINLLDLSCKAFCKCDVHLHINGSGKASNKCQD